MNTNKPLKQNNIYDSYKKIIENEYRTEKLNLHHQKQDIYYQTKRELSATERKRVNYEFIIELSIIPPAIERFYTGFNSRHL